MFFMLQNATIWGIWSQYENQVKLPQIAGYERNSLFCRFSKNKILQSEELNRKSPVPQITGLIEIPHFVGYSWIKSYKMRNHHLTWLKTHFNESIEQFVSITTRHWHQKLISQSSSYCSFYHVRYPTIWGIPNCFDYHKFLRL